MAASKLHRPCPNSTLFDVTHLILSLNINNPNNLIDHQQFGFFSTSWVILLGKVNKIIF